MRYRELEFGVQNGRKIDFLAFLSLWVGPLRLKRLRKDQASHGIALDTLHAYILKKKIGQEWDGTPKIGIWGPEWPKNGRKWS